MHEHFLTFLLLIQTITFTYLFLFLPVVHCLKHPPFLFNTKGLLTGITNVIHEYQFQKDILIKKKNSTNLRSKPFILLSLKDKFVHN